MINWANLVQQRGLLPKRETFVSAKSGRRQKGFKLFAKVKAETKGKTTNTWWKFSVEVERLVALWRTDKFEPHHHPSKKHLHPEGNIAYSILWSKGLQRRWSPHLLVLSYLHRESIRSIESANWKRHCARAPTCNPKYCAHSKLIVCNPNIDEQAQVPFATQWNHCHRQKYTLLVRHGGDHKKIPKILVQSE